MSETNTPRDFGWVMLELMGHRQRIGLAREEEIAGGLMLRIDIPTSGESQEYVTEYYGTTSIPLAKRTAGRLLDGEEHNGMPV